MALSFTVKGVPLNDENHWSWLRGITTDKIYEIHSRQAGVGTGFAVVAPNGQTYTITNSHVCESIVRDDNRSVVIVQNELGSIDRKILKISNESDLCLVEGVPGAVGLQVADLPPLIGQIVYAIGHPLMQMTTMTSGEVRGYEQVEFVHHTLKTSDAGLNVVLDATDEPCTQPKNEIRADKLKLFDFITVKKVRQCFIIEHHAISTTITIYPGSSGSPLMNKWGQVIGVIFAVDNRSSWGYAVHLDYLKQLLQNP